MSLKIMALAWVASCDSHTQKLVLIALADNANDEGVCWPSVSTLERKCSLSRQGVLDQIERLQKAGHLKVIREAGKVNRYNLSPVNGVDRSPPPLVNGVDQSLVSPVDPSTPLTRQPDGLPLVNGVDPHQSTALTALVNGVDPNRKEPSGEPSLEPSGFELGELPKIPGRPPLIKPTKSAGWQEDIKREADHAADTVIPTMPEQVASALKDFFDYRYDRATTPKLKSLVVPWTRRAAAQTIMVVQNAIASFGPDAVVQRIRSAIGGNWKGLNLDTFKPTSANGQHPKHPRTDSANAPDRYK